MKKVLLLSALSLGLGACTVTTRTTLTAPATVIPVSAPNIIRFFAPDRGAGSTYFVGQSVSFRLTASRPGYLTLVSLDPDGYSEVIARNLYVPAGTAFLPRPTDGVNLTLAPPRGLQRVRAIFTAAQFGDVDALLGRYDQNGWRVNTDAALRAYGTNDRDVAETYFYIR